MPDTHAALESDDSVAGRDVHRVGVIGTGTMATGIIEELPGEGAVRGRTPSILFSLLRPGMHIAPHHGFMNARYICHLPLIVPEGCAMRVGSQTRAWTEGHACLFDDSIEHEAWNKHPDRLRVVLIFDV